MALVAPSGAGQSTLLHLAGPVGEAGRRRGLCRRRADLGDVRHNARAAPRRDRLRLSVPSSAAGILGVGEHRPAADDLRPGRGRSAPSARTSCSPIWALSARKPPPGGALGRRAAARRHRPSASPTRRACCWRTSPPAISTPRRRTTCSGLWTVLVKASRVAALVATHDSGHGGKDGSAGDAARGAGGGDEQGAHLRRGHN